jgi:hypothetical protein
MLSGGVLRCGCDRGCVLSCYMLSEGVSWLVVVWMWLSCLVKCCLEVSCVVVVMVVVCYFAVVCCLKVSCVVVSGCGCGCLVLLYVV